MECAKCGYDVPVGVKFCSACGTRVQPRDTATAAAACPQCAAPHTASVKFCKQCGFRFEIATAPRAGMVAATAMPVAIYPCPDCGTDCAPSAKFCRKCGHAFATVAGSTNAAPEPVVPVAPKPAPVVTGPVSAVPEPSPIPGTSANDPAITSESAPVAAHAEPASAPMTKTQTAERSGVESVGASEAERGVVPDASQTAAATSPPVQDPGVVFEMPRGATPEPSRALKPESNGLPGWLLGVLAAVVMVLVGGSAFVVYAKFFKPVPYPEAAAVPASATSTVANASPVATAPVASANTSAAVATASTITSQGPVTSTPVTTAPDTQEAIAPAPAAVAGAPVAVPVSPPPVATRHAAAHRELMPDAAPARPLIDHSLKVASQLVNRGENAFARQDYSTAIANAKAALDVRPGYVRARRLLDRAEAAQQQAMNNISIH